MRRFSLCLAAIGAAAPAWGDTLTAHPGPATNGGAANWAFYFDLQAVAGPVTVTELTTANTGAAGAGFSVEVLVHAVTGLGGTLSGGPGGSFDGWTSLGTAPATQGATTNGISLPIDIPDIALAAGESLGVALRFTGAGPRYADVAVYATYADSNLSLKAGDSRSQPFTGSGSYFTPRTLVGSVTYTTGGSSCYANCDASTAAPTLNVQDFSCFLQKFASGDAYANCDASTAAPTLNVQDFSCFLAKFATGCP